MQLDRIQKVLAANGVVSRRNAEKLIEQKRVKVNGRLATLGMKINPKRDLVTIDEKKVFLESKQQKYYYMLHKPRGYITTMDDEMGRKCVADLMKDTPVRVYPVGRLDKDSEGLLLFTNDGDFANRVMHPSKKVNKTYRVTVRPSIDDEQLIQLSQGVVIDGKKTLPASVRVLTQEPGRVVLEMTISEGRNRQIRKMCEALGLEVARLKRNTVGPVKLGVLRVGTYRELKPIEVLALKNATGQNKQEGK